MWWKTASILAALWLLAMVTGYRLGGAIHILLAFAMVMGLLSFVRRRRVS